MKIPDYNIKSCYSLLLVMCMCAQVPFHISNPIVSENISEIKLWQEYRRAVNH